MKTELSATSLPIASIAAGGIFLLEPARRAAEYPIAECGIERQEGT
jgi:hypothetical protein